MKIAGMNRFHLDGVYALEEECFAHPWTRDGLEEYLNNPNAYFFVASEAEEVVGYIGTYMVRDEAYITNIAVTKAARKRGVGKALLSRAVQNAKSNGASFITLEVRLSNSAAVGLYKALDFESEGIRPNFYRDPKEDALIMTLHF